MPTARIVRQLGSHWGLLQKRAQAYATSIPPTGIGSGAYVAAVLHDLDPSAISEVLILLHRRKLVWVRRSRGEVRVFGMRPASICTPANPRTAAVNSLCASLAPHMLALGRAEVARRGARTDAQSDLANEHAAEGVMHADRTCAIIRAHVTRGLPLAAVREALPYAFAEPAIDALTRREPNLSLCSNEDALPVGTQPQRSERLPRGLDLEGKVLAIVQRAGDSGLTRTGLMQAIRPKPTADVLSDIVASLEATGKVGLATRQADASGRGRRYVAAMPLP